MVVAFVHGSATGATLNYTLVHLLHVTDPATHFVATSVVAMFRGFAGSFGSAIGGGIFVRVLRARLVAGFESRGLGDEEGLVRRLLGSPKLVASLTGAERAVAMNSYEGAIRTLFLAGTILTILATLLQACTGWRAPDMPVKEVDEPTDRAVC